MLQRMPNVDAASARQGSPEPRVPNHMKPRRSCTMAETTFAIYRPRLARGSRSAEEVSSEVLPARGRPGPQVQRSVNA